MIGPKKVMLVEITNVMNLYNRHHIGHVIKVEECDNETYRILTRGYATFIKKEFTKEQPKKLLIGGSLVEVPTKGGKLC